MTEKTTNPLSEKERWMVLVPHEDDEILMAAGLIYQAVRANQPIDVVMATNGDYGCADHTKGEARLRESIAALKLLGLEPEHFHILGYADTGMPKSESFLTHLFEDETPDRIWPSSCSKQTYGLPEQEEYHWKKYKSHADYTRRAFLHDLTEIICDLQPTRIYTTARSDLHGDHSALFQFVCEVLDEQKEDRELYVGVIHSNAGDDSWPERGTREFSAPEGFEEKNNLRWEDRIRLALPEEMRLSRGKENLKYRALSLHKTALEPDAVDFLYSFVKEEEIFWRAN